MTKNQTTYKKSLIQKIQISKHNVFSDDEMRKEFMLSRFGVDSTTKMSIDELKLFLDFCNRKVSDIPYVELITESQGWRINSLWQEKANDKSNVALLKFVKKISKKQYLSELTKYEATKVIIALENLKV
ncbi:MAG: phage protein GemA/Gp16 family protein [Candidatus Paceibacteria bacterium]